MKKEKSAHTDSQLKIKIDWQFLSGFIFLVLALGFAVLAAFNRYIPESGGSSFVTVTPLPQDIEQYFLGFLERDSLLYNSVNHDDLLSTDSEFGFPSSLLFLPNTKDANQCVSKLSRELISEAANNENWKKCQEELDTMNSKTRVIAAAYFARRFAHAGNFKACEFFLQECRQGFTFQELYDLDLKIIEFAQYHNHNNDLLGILKTDINLHENANEAFAVQYVVHVLIIGTLMEKEGKVKEAISFYKNALEKAENWASVAPPVSWHHILPAFLHYTVWRSQEKNKLSDEYIEKALSSMRQNVPVNRWTWKYHQAVRDRAKNHLRNNSAWIPGETISEDHQVETAINR